MPALVPGAMVGQGCCNDASLNRVEDIVISGISGRFPESDNMDEFTKNLMQHKDMVNDDDRRWPCGLYGLPTRTGKLKDLSKFDSTFFGVHAKQANVMDPQLRILLEVVYEAIVDAGVNPQDIRGTKTGVYIGASVGESEEFWSSDPEKINGYELTGCCRAMFANRISYAFNFTGPSLSMDTACSSSMMALYQAVLGIQSGACDAAIVGGAHVILKPASSLQFHRLSMLSSEGKCKAFDSSANGYVRSDAIAACYLRKSKDAKRIYATILNIKSNTDGFKDLGITFPSGAMQKNLIEEVYSEVGVNPADVAYIEAHGTGTKAGDPQEVNSIAQVFCKGRTTPLLIGSVKSNMGHSEVSSGLCSIAKVLIAMESGTIPANLHFQTPNPDIPALLDNRLQVVDKNIAWKGGLVGINSFGFGGANVHVLLKSNQKTKATPPQTSIPKLVAVSGRTLQSVDTFIKKIEERKENNYFLNLIHEIHSKNIPGHMYRGYAVLGDDMKREILEQIGESRQVWYVFSGMGSQWVGMARDLMVLKPFSDAIHKCAAALNAHGVDLIYLITKSVEEDFENIINTFVTITAIQVALVDVLAYLGVQPDGIVGHSIGELSCAYADGAFTAEQTVLSAFWRGLSIAELKLPPGAMAATGLSWEEAVKRCPKGVQPACHNAADSVTISGPPDLIDNFAAELMNEGVFCKKVSSNNVAFHSMYIQEAGQRLRASLEKIIPVAKQRSKRWLSTSIPQSGWNTQLASQSSAAYHVNNLLSPVLFHSTIQHIPENSTVIEIAPHSLLQAVLKRSLPKTCSHIPLVRKQTGLDFLLASIGKIYNGGLNPKLQKLYPGVSFPVPRGTPTISSMVEWDHGMSWDVADFSTRDGARSGESIIEVDMSNESDKYIAGHTIDGRVLFPATGYMTLVWKTFAKLHQKEFEEFPVVMEDVQFKRATIVPKEGSVKFLINIFDASGEFELCEGGAPVVTGKIQRLTDQKPTDIGPLSVADSNGHLPLKPAHVYRDLRLRGYDYNGLFKGIKQSDNFGNVGYLEWKENWVSFMDTMLQFSLIGMDTRELYLPTRIQRVIVDPIKHLAAIKSIQEDQGIPIQSDKYIGVVQSGGIEIKGMKASLAPRKLVTHSQPKLEQYSFVPYFSNKDMGVMSALTVQLHTILENFNGATLLKIAEMGQQVQPEMLVAPTTQSIFESEPRLDIDMTVLTDDVDSIISITEPLGIKVLNKDLSAAPLDNKFHCIMTTRAMTDAKTLKNIKESLHPGGFLLVESASDLPDAAMKQTGFDYIAKTVGDLKVFHLFRVILEEMKTPIIVDITQNDFKWLDKLKEAMKKCESDFKQPLVLYSRGEPDCGIIGMANCIKFEAGGENTRCVFIMDNNSNPKFSINGDEVVQQLKKNLIMNVFKVGEWGTMRHTMINQSSELSRVEHAYINTLVRGDLSSLHWIEAPQSFYRPENDKGLEMCTVYYAPLNFRDIMLATGKLPPDALPGDLAGQDCVLGLEFSGRNSNGERVMGILTARGLATSVLADPLFLWPVPSSWTLEQAATVPVVFATSYYALLVRGRMRKGESVLIHAGTGGVGQAAISIALNMGCNVFTTVGTQQKREFLVKTFPQLNEKHIGNSRDTSFEAMVLRETKGRGVDLVLNSLAEDKLQASVRCLARDGRFLEIGKLDLSNNTPLGMSILLKNTAVHGILLDSLFDAGSENHEKLKVVRLMKEGIASGAVRPLPATTFTSNQIEQSFRFMATGKHIGKVVLKIRDEEREIKVAPKPNPVAAVPRTYMNPDKSYILVGGLGGFGLELCDWMLRRGARHIVLVSRSGVTSGYQSLCLRRWANRGIKVVVSTQDLTTLTGAKKLIQEACKLAPVGGIFNLAGVLRDALIQDQTEANFVTVCKSKVDTTRCLDLASRELCDQLDYFVVFSSFFCGRGNPGQANYGLANSSMERICEERQHIGLPAVAIQWGAIGDVGMVIDEMGGSNEIAISGTLPQRIPSCMETLDYFLRVPHPVVSSTVLAEKRETASVTEQISLVDSIANILGIKDVKAVSGHSSLADLGMDSLMGAEIKQTLERNFDVMLSAAEIRSLTFSKLESISSGGSQTTKQPETKSTNQQVQFQGESLIPKETLTKMKQGNGQSNLFIVHPIEGDVSSLVLLGTKLPQACSVYGLQASVSVPITSIPSIASHYVKEMKSVQTEGPYTICGYSFGACVAFEMCLQLEKEGSATFLVLLDGSPKYVTSAIFRHREKRSNKDFDADHTAALTYFISLFTNIDFVKTQKELMAVKANDRYQLVSDKLKDKLNFVEEEIRTAAKVYYEKIAALIRYIPDSKYTRDIILVKASDNFMDDSQDYGLSEMCDKRVSVHTVAGDHRTILTGNGASTIAAIIKSYIPTW